MTNRKEYPLATGVLEYFPDALLEVAHVSYVGARQHNQGGPMRWDRSKSPDHKDALLRHLVQAGTYDTDGLRHSAKAAWRALALLQVEIEQSRKTDRALLSEKLVSHDAPGVPQADPASAVVPPRRPACWPYDQIGPRFTPGGIVNDWS